MKSPPSPATPTLENGTVNRVLRILSCLADKKSWGLNELARELNLPRASTHRLLSLCKQSSFVDQDRESGRYMPGLQFYRLAARLADDMPINRVAEPILQAVRDKTGETALLTLLARNELARFYSLEASPPHPMRYLIEKHVLQPLAWGAAGTSLLAFLTQEEIAEVIRREQALPSEGLRTLPPELIDTLATIRREGYAMTYAQRVPESHGIAVPFFDADNEVRGNLSVTIPDFRYASHRPQEVVALLREAAATLSRQLGWAN